MAKGRTYFQRLSEKEIYRQESIALLKAKRLRAETKAKNEETNKVRAALEKYMEENVPVAEQAEASALEAEI